MNETSNGLKAFEVLGEFLDEDGWYPEQLGDQFFYKMLFDGQNADLSIYARIRPEPRVLLCYGSLPFDIPSGLLPTAAEFIARANYGLRLGNFELDFRDGEVRFKSSLHFEDVPLMPQLIKNTLYPCAYTLDRHFPGFQAIVYEGKSATEAITMLEGSAMPS